MYFKDFEPYSYGLPDGRMVDGTACIGWLEAGSDVVSGTSVPKAFIGVLRGLIRTRSVNKARGNHVCTLCSERIDTFVNLGGEQDVLLGNAELWVPSDTTDVVYVAPNLIYHYVVEHGYAPPEDFVRAVLHAERKYEQWNPETESERMLDSAFV